MSRRLAVALVLFGVLSPLAVGQDSQAGDARAESYEAFVGAVGTVFTLGEGTQPGRVNR